MNKTWTVAKREFISNIRRPAFLLAAFGMPLLLIGVMIVIIAITVQNESLANRLGNIGYVDQSGVLAEGREKPELFIAYADETSARTALDADEIGAFFVVADDYLQTGDIDLYSFEGAPEALFDEIDSFLIANLSTGSQDQQLVERLQDPVNMALQTLDNGRILRGGEVVGLFLAPFIFVFVIVFAIQTTNGYLMSGVVEEKSNRIIEVLITSVTPLQLLFGKILGLGALGLVQFGVWVAGGALLLYVGRTTEALGGVSLPLDFVLVGLFYFLITYLLFASLMAGIGAVVGSEQESRQYAGIFSLALSLPFFFILQFMQDPNGPIPVALTLFPFSASISVVLRYGLGNIPAWQLIASAVILVLTTGFVIVAAARVFRWSLLMYGKRPNLRQIVGAILRGSRTAVVQEPR